MKVRKIDFVICDSKDERLIFRFYPRQSHCHSFNEKPPTTPEEVYKVYYSYAILHQQKYEEQLETEVMFRETCDECSVIDEVGHRCIWLSRGIEEVERKDGAKIQIANKAMYPFGMGTSWNISKLNNGEYLFTLFDWVNRGFRFSLPQNKLKSFGEYLLNVCNYMLAHGEGI